MRTELFSRNQPGGVFTITNLPEHPGELFFVDSNSTTGADAAGYGKNPDQPFLTLDYAIGQCTADKGDVIYLMPKHAETKSASGSLFAADVAGIRIIGLGSGADRPTFTFSHTGAATTISANGISIENVLLVAGVDSVAAPMTISGADVTLRKVEWRDTTDIEFVRCFVTTAAADRLTVEDCVHNGYTGGNASVNFCRLTGVNGAIFRNNRYLGNYSTAIIEFHTTQCTDINIVGDIFLETGTTDLSKNVVDTVGTSTWFCSGFDLAAGCSFSGGSGAALAKDDVSAVATAVAALQTDLGDPSARTNLQTIVAMLGNPDVAAQSIWDALGGAGGLATFPASAAPANNVSLAEVLRDIWDALRNGTGGTEPGANKSVIDCLGTDGVAVTDSAVSVLGAVGADNANNAFASTNVVANADGSVLEREEYIQAAVDAIQTDLGNPSARTNLQTIVAMLGNPDVAAQSIWDALAGAGGLATFPNGAAPANDVSLAEVLRDIWDALRNGTGGAEPATNRAVMDYLGASPAFFVPGLGYAVTKTEDIADDTTGDDLFTVTGKVLITCWTGEVLTAAIGADCTDYKLRVKTDNIDLCAASDIHGAAVKFIWQMNSDAGDTLINTASAKDTADTNGKGVANRVVGIAGGSLTLQSLHTDPNTSTATMLHTLFYLPLEAGAAIVAAA